MFFLNLFTVLCDIRQRNEIAISPHVRFYENVKHKKSKCILKKNFNGKAIEDKMNHYRHELLSINTLYKLFNFK